jgi:S-adenosylmethionine-diacylglycerol 3-amino-3-carboxypropyl transferase
MPDRIDRPYLRNAYSWQDAETMLHGLDIQPGDTCLGVVGGADNVLAMLLRDPAKVVAIDSSRAHIANLELRIAAFRHLDYADMLVLLGLRPGLHRAELYQRCRPFLSRANRQWWDVREADLCRGIATLGVWERYYSFYARHILPLVHSRKDVADLFTPRDRNGREAFFARHWDTPARRLITRAFFSRPIIALFDPDRYFLGDLTVDLADFVRQRSYRALVEQDPSRNPYLRWILTGSFGDLLPLPYRPEHFDHIRANLDRLEWRHESMLTLLHELGVGSVDRIDLGIQTEHLQPHAYRAWLDRLLRAGRRGGRIIHWNFLVPRSRPAGMDAWLVPLTELSQQLTANDLTFFHHSVVVEEIANPTTGVPL